MSTSNAKKAQAQQRALKVSSPTDWAEAFAEQEATEKVQLPVSKMVALLRKPDVIGMMLEDGDLPESLSSTIAGAISQNPQAASQAPALTVADFPKLRGLIDRICINAFVTPAIGDHLDLEGGIIPLSKLDTLDKIAVMNWAMKGKAAKMNTFPEIKQERGVHPALSRKTVRAKT